MHSVAAIKFRSPARTQRVHSQKMFCFSNGQIVPLLISTVSTCYRLGNKECLTNSHTIPGYFHNLYVNCNNKTDVKHAVTKF
jgi:hypothetical protein